jgi:hypothetical protein
MTVLAPELAAEPPERRDGQRSDIKVQSIWPQLRETSQKILVACEFADKAVRTENSMLDHYRRASFVLGSGMMFEWQLRLRCSGPTTKED